jgi:16S rRNA (cytidine1402-2'-O)-methyltransferase
MLENTFSIPEENFTDNPTGAEEVAPMEYEGEGHLYVVSTPIGNRNDISQRAISTLKNADLVVCEEMKLGARLLHQLNLRNELDNLNEQNEEIKTSELISMLKDGKSLALISDAGTPVFADPGYMLVKRAIESKIAVTVVPGASSIMTALVRSSFPMKSFLFAGFLSRTPSERLHELTLLSEEPRTVCLLETPYRLLPLLEAAARVMPNRNAYIGFNLTMPFETHHYGTFKELFEHFSEKRLKAEFVICFEGVDPGRERRTIERFVPAENAGSEEFFEDSNRQGRSFDRSDRKRDSKSRDNRGKNDRFGKGRDDRDNRDRGDRFGKGRDDRDKRDRGDRFGKGRDDRDNRDRGDRFGKGRDDRDKRDRGDRFGKGRDDKFGKKRDNFSSKSDKKGKFGAKPKEKRELYSKDITKEVLQEFSRRK